MSVRRATPSDARGIAEVHVAAWQAVYRGLLPDTLLDNLSVDDSEQRWAGRLTGAWGQFLVSERDGDVVGFAACGATQDADANRQETGEVYVVYVRPREWRRGHGRSLLGESLSLLREQGFREVMLWVLEDNRQAIAFYEAEGFVADGASKVKTRAGGVEMHVARYRRSI